MALSQAIEPCSAHLGVATAGVLRLSACKFESEFSTSVSFNPPRDHAASGNCSGGAVAGTLTRIFRISSIWPA